MGNRWTEDEKIQLTGLLRVGHWGLLIVGVVFLLAQFLTPHKHPDILTPGKYQLALKYNLTEDQVFMDPKPKGCDFTDAPLGDKHCHFAQCRARMSNTGLSCKACLRFVAQG